MRCGSRELQEALLRRLNAIATNDPSRTLPTALPEAAADAASSGPVGPSNPTGQHATIPPRLFSRVPAPTTGSTLSNPTSLSAAVRGPSGGPSMVGPGRSSGRPSVWSDVGSVLSDRMSSPAASRSSAPMSLQAAMDLSRQQECVDRLRAVRVMVASAQSSAGGDAAGARALLTSIRMLVRVRVAMCDCGFVTNSHGL